METGRSCSLLHSGLSSGKHGFKVEVMVVKDVLFELGEGMWTVMEKGMRFVMEEDM